MFESAADIGNDSRSRDVYNSILDQGDRGLPMFMIDDRKLVRELESRGLVYINSTGLHTLDIAFATNNTTRLQALADLIFNPMTDGLP